MPYKGFQGYRYAPIALLVNQEDVGDWLDPKPAIGVDSAAQVA